MTSYTRRYDAAVREALAPRGDPPRVTMADLDHLPPPVRAYVLRSGALGRPRVENFRAVFTGDFRNGPDKPWMAFRSEQVNGCSEPERLFLMKARLHGIPMEGLHLFRSSAATMQIKVAHLFQVVDAKGPQMDQGETVTFFNDLCLLAPAGLVDRKRIAWEEAGPLAATARFTLRGITIRATLTFAPDGDLVDFLSPDRFMSADGKTFENLPWSTPVRDYRDFGGRRVMTYGEARWHMSRGEFCYGRFNLAEISYNL